MSLPIGSDSSSPLTDATAQANKESQAPAPGGSSGGFSSLEDLKKKEPEFYNLVITGMATAFCQDQKNKYDRIKRLSREWQNGG